MGISIFSNFMGRSIFLLILSLLLIPASTHLQSSEDGYISVLLSSKGIDFAKDLLINKAVSTMIPLQLPDIEKSVKIPLIGTVHLLLSNITIYSVNISSSYVETGETGIVLVVSGATADLSMKWKYSYSSWIFVISDHGDASVAVEGMEMGLTVAIKEQGGALKLSVLDCGCHVKDISVMMDGGASWLYQVMIDSFEGPIGSAVEQAISKKITEGIVKLDSRLQSLPNQIPVDHAASLNITFVDNPRLDNSSIEFVVNGLFTAMDNVSFQSYLHKGAQASCNLQARMIEISLDESVLNSGSLVHFNAGYMHWMVDKFPNQSLLNTAAWKYVYPELYIQYPNDNITLNISVTSPPVVRILEHAIDATIYLDVTVNVLDAGEVIPVVSVLLIINTSCSPQIVRNNLAGMLKLNNFNVTLKWSKIGDVHMHLLQSVAFTILKTFIIPYINLHLMKGFPLPLIHGVVLQNAEIHYAYSKIMICSNLAIT